MGLSHWNGKKCWLIYQTLFNHIFVNAENGELDQREGAELWSEGDPIQIYNWLSDDL